MANRVPDGIRVSDVKFTALAKGTDGPATAVVALDPDVLYPAAEHGSSLF